MTNIDQAKILLTHKFIIHEGKILYKKLGSTCSDCYFHDVNMSCASYPCTARDANFIDPNWQSYYTELI
jgi:hypothetical protein